MHKIKIKSIAIILASLLIITAIIAYNMSNTAVKDNSQVNTNNVVISTEEVCNTNLIKSQGMDSSRTIDIEACNLLNLLYKQGKSSGNSQDVYENRDNLHVNFCEGWTPNPECPQEYSLFPQHDWIINGNGMVHSPSNKVTVGQASYRGQEEHGIPYVYYKNQKNAEEAYTLYTSSNLYIYPSLDDDSFIGKKEDAKVMENPILERETMNIANTPYIIGSRQIAKAGTDYYTIHDGSGSEIPFVKLALAGLASFKPEIKQKLTQKINANDQEISFLIPTLQMLIRYSHISIEDSNDYLNNEKIHGSTYMAHYLRSGLPEPYYRANKLITMTNSLEIEDIPPLIQLKVISQDFTNDEKLFDTPGAIARSINYNTKREITVSAKDSFDISGKTDNLEYVWKVLENKELINLQVNSQDPSQATIEFLPTDSTQRLEVFVFVKKKSGKYYSVPGVISNYIHE